MFVDEYTVAGVSDLLSRFVSAPYPVLFVWATIRYGAPLRPISYAPYIWERYGKTSALGRTF